MGEIKIEMDYASNINQVLIQRWCLKPQGNQGVLRKYITFSENY